MGRQILVDIPGQFYHTPKDVTCLISIYNCVNIILKQNNENLVGSSNLLIGDPRGMQDACKI